MFNGLMTQRLGNIHASSRWYVRNIRMHAVLRYNSNNCIPLYTRYHHTYQACHASRVGAGISGLIQLSDQPIAIATPAFCFLLSCTTSRVDYKSKSEFR